MVFILPIAEKKPPTTSDETRKKSKCCFSDLSCENCTFKTATKIIAVVQLIKNWLSLLIIIIAIYNAHKTLSKYADDDGNEFLLYTGADDRLWSLLIIAFIDVNLNWLLLNGVKQENSCLVVFWIIYKVITTAFETIYFTQIQWTSTYNSLSHSSVCMTTLIMDCFNLYFCWIVYCFYRQIKEEKKFKNTLVRHEYLTSH